MIGERIIEGHEALTLSSDARFLLMLFVALRPGSSLDDELRAAISRELRTALSPRHVPD